MKKIFRLVTAIFSVAVMASISRGAGVTVITHGYDQYFQGYPAWVDSMAQAITNAAGQKGLKTSWYHLQIGGNTFTGLTGTLTTRSATAANDAEEIVLTVDWSALADHNAFGENVTADDIAPWIAGSLLVTNQAGSYLASRPLHLIGHSRGAVVMLETAKILGAYGIWVDQVTTLDPHPLASGDLGVLFNTPLDPTPTLYENVVFADNYWRWPEYPAGESIAGSEDISLDDSKFGILDPPHSDVHSWYHGTIYTDGGYPTNDGLNGVGGANIPNSWYLPSNPARNNGGFFFTRIENNFIHYRPAFSYAIGQAFGGHAQRATTSRAGGTQWANIGQIHIPDYPNYPNNRYPQGQPITATFKYQDRDSGGRIEWFMDTDTNPFNNTGSPLIVQNFDSTGDKVSSGSVNIPTAGLSVGLTRHLLAKITSNNNNTVRYEYADNTFLITWPEFGLQSITPDSVVAGAGVTRLTLHGSAFAPSDKVLFFNGTTTTPVTPVSVAADQIVVDFDFGSTLRTWSLSVQQYIDILPYRTSESLPVEVLSSTPTGPTITQQPADATISFGHTTNFTVAVTGAGTLSYQWERNGQPIPNATNIAYTTSPVSYANDGYTYLVRVTDDNGTTASRLATLNVVSQISACNDPMEPNDHSYQATILPLGVVTNGLICSPSDVDWFKVTLVTNGLLNLSLVVPGGLDFDLELYGTNLAWVAGSYNAAGQNESIQQTLSSGDYYVRVYGYPAGNGSYSQTQPYQLSANASDVRPPGPLSGYITNDVSWSGVVEVTGDVTIVGGGSLTILPGTQVRCASGDDRSSGNDSSRVEIILNGGTLNASGTADAPIRFTSRAQNPAPGDWYGIRLVQGSVSLSHFLIEFAAYGLRLEDGDTRFDSYVVEHGAIRNSSNYALYQTGSQGTVELNDLSVTNNSNGIQTSGPLLMRDSRINRNTGTGISGSSYSLTLTNCDVSTNDGSGIQVDSKALVVQNCTILANVSYGLYDFQGSAEVRDSQIQRNTYTGVYLYRCAVTFVGNTVSQNGGQGVVLGFDGNGGSVSVEGITGNVIRNNDVGVVIQGNSLPVLNLSGNDIYQNISFELRNDSSIPVLANGNYWGDPTTTELAQARLNLSRIWDIRDGASAAVIINQWYANSVTGGSPGPAHNLDYTLYVPGAQVVSGLVDTTTTWSGKMLVVGDVTVTGDLTIAAGTQILFDPKHDARTGGTDGSRCEIILNGGSLTVAGTDANPVLFTSAATSKQPGDWYGIRLVQGSVSLSHFLIEFAAYGLRLEDGDTRFDSYVVEHGAIRNSSNYALYQTGSQGTVELNDLSVTNNSNGIQTSGPLLMRDSRINRNTGTGISGSSYSLTLTNCDVSTNDGSGIQVDSKALVVQNCTILANVSYGLYDFQGSAEVRDSQIQRNTYTGVYLYRCAVTFVGNTVSQNGGQGVVLGFDGNGGSVSVEGITGNVIRNNDVGVVIQGNSLPVLNLSGNDIYQNISFELRNDSSISITANNCYWGEPTTTELTAGLVNLSRIWDIRDNPSYGQVLIQTIRGTAVLQVPRFTTQPQSVSALPGDNVTILAEATGSEPITYQWYRNGGTVALATNTELTLASLDASKAGNYFVVAANAAGCATSAVAQVTLILPPAPPVIVQNPVSQTVSLGASVSFAVAATGTGPFIYHWNKNGAPIPGANAATFSILSVLVSDAAQYTATVSNAGGNSTSQPATLTVNTLGGSVVTRQITRSGTNFFVTVTVVPPIATPAYLVEEYVPTNFTVLNVSSYGSLDAPNGRIVWGVFWDGLTRTLSYTLVPPPGFTGTTTINGSALFFGATATTGGDNQITVVPLKIHPRLESRNGMAIL